MDTRKNNKLIAEFMGWNKGEKYSENYPFYNAWNEPIDQVLPFEMLFNKSWDWLIPVVHKIYEKGLDNELTLQVRDALAEISIKDTYTTVISFINWYNDQESNDNLASTIYNTLGINIVTCGDCGAINLHKTGLEEITCEYCNNTSDISDFPDLFDVTPYTQEYTLTWTSPKFSHIREELKNLIDEGCNTEYTRGALEIISSFMKPSDDMIHADIAIQLAKDLGIPQENIDKLY